MAYFNHFHKLLSNSLLLGRMFEFNSQTRLLFEIRWTNVLFQFQIILLLQSIVTDYNLTFFHNVPTQLEGCLISISNYTSNLQVRKRSNLQIHGIKSNSAIYRWKVQNGLRMDSSSTPISVENYPITNCNLIVVMNYFKYVEVLHLLVFFIYKCNNDLQLSDAQIPIILEVCKLSSSFILFHY